MRSMKPTMANILAELAPRDDTEQSDDLVRTESLCIERIVSHGHASPPGFWYDQDAAEWVVVIEGSARLQIEGEPAPRLLERGDWIDLPAHCRHRLEWTDPSRPTIWLAVHYR